MTAALKQSSHRERQLANPSPREIRRRAARIREAWSPVEREFRREVGQVQQHRLVATLLRSAA
jgi:hypothetical protein